MPSFRSPERRAVLASLWAGSSRKPGTRYFRTVVTRSDSQPKWRHGTSSGWR
ncbi:hypothetical protein NGM36_24210 [Streptomyces mutabilis]|uniref:hypothetical protein n=1 Tax=Streptomyces mutabilis TaxID=67332 RepID=UPI0022BA1B38|nr:hypothetical protein [Streptomyces mutabilis]MCZ9352839.1 hypothetical protein [Streptomyces mutabilis]